MSKEKLVPKLRFEEFWRDNIWELKSLEEIVDITMGQSPSSKNYTNNPSDYILVQGNSDLKNGKVFPRTWTTQVTKKANKGDLILSVRAPVGDVGKTDFDVVLGRGVAAITGNEFIFQLLTKMKVNNYWTNLITGSTFESINSNDIKNAKVFFPRKEEQNKIGSFFKNIDELIQLQKSKVNKVKDIKSAYLSEMFPKEGEKYPKKRFDGFTKEWSFKKLEALTTTFTDGDWIESKDQSDSGVRLIQTGNIGITKFLDKPKNKKWISKRTFTKLNCEEIFPGDILISRLPEPAGRATIIPELNTRMITAVDCTIVRPSSEYSSDFLIQYLSTSNYFNKITAELAGGTRQRISRSNLAEVKVPVPKTLEEQEKIGQFFKNLDNQISVEENKLAKLEKLKQAYLNDMFV